jgi:hypothetical protein
MIGTGFTTVPLPDRGLISPSDLVKGALYGRFGAAIPAGELRRCRQGNAGRVQAAGDLIADLGGDLTEADGHLTSSFLILRRRA